MVDVILKRFEEPDETRSFSKGKFELVHIGGMAIGRATYDPGWRWSVDVGGPAGLSHCMVEHVGLVVAGKAVASNRSVTRQTSSSPGRDRRIRRTYCRRRSLALPSQPHSGS